MAQTESPKSALIIGASRGLGLGLSLELLKRGWEVTATVRSAAGGTGLEAYHERVTMDTVDINNLAMVDALAARMKSKLFDVVLVNAGIGGAAGKTAANVSPEDFTHLFMTNAVAPVRLAERLVGCVKPGTGIIAFMSSLLGSVTLRENSRMGLYGASKAALNSLTRGFAGELPDKSITVITMHPGWVRTELGGTDAPLDVDTSARGMANVLEEQAGTGGHRFLNYKGEELPW